MDLGWRLIFDTNFLFAHRLNFPSKQTQFERPPIIEMKLYIAVSKTIFEAKPDVFLSHDSLQYGVIAFP